MLNKKKVTNQRELKILFVITIMLFCGCGNSPNSENHVTIIKVSDQLYKEVYKTLDWVVHGEYKDYYITDSIKFRKYIGQADEDAIYTIKKKNNTIIVSVYKHKGVDKSWV